MCNLGRPFCTSGDLAGAIWDVPFAHAWSNKGNAFESVFRVDEG